MVAAFDVPLGHLALDDPGCRAQSAGRVEPVDEPADGVLPEPVAGGVVLRGEKRPGGRWTGVRCAGRRRSSSGLGRVRYVLMQPTVVPPQSRELLTLGAGEPVQALASIALSLLEPLPDRRLGQVEVPGDLPDGPVAALTQLDDLSLELRRERTPRPGCLPPFLPCSPCWTSSPGHSPWWMSVKAGHAQRATPDSASQLLQRSRPSPGICVIRRQNLRPTDPIVASGASGGHLRGNYVAMSRPHRVNGMAADLAGTASRFCIDNRGTDRSRTRHRLVCARL
jgi:hypothetical protein